MKALDLELDSKSTDDCGCCCRAIMMVKNRVLLELSVYIGRAPRPMTDTRLCTHARGLLVKSIQS
jgi:hypothetical protein